MSASASASVSASGPVPAPAATNTSTLSPVEGAVNEAQQKYLAQREVDLRKKYDEITAYDTHPQVSLYNTRDIGLMKDYYADLEAYFNTHRTQKESALDVQLVKRLTPINDIIGALGPRTVVGWMVATFDAQVTAGAVGSHKLTEEETKLLKKYADEVRSFYVSNPSGTKTAYLKTAVNYLKAYMALGPAFAQVASPVLEWAISIDVKHAMNSVAGPVEAAKPPQSIWAQVLKAFLSGIVAAVMIGFFILCGTFAANDAITRPRPYRVLNFIYGALGNVITLLYYIYRYFTAPVKRFAVIPLIELDPGYQYTSFMDKILKMWFHYIPDPVYEDVLKQRWSEAQECSIGADVSSESQN